MPTAEIANDAVRVRPLPEYRRSLDDFQLKMAGEVVTLDAFMARTATDGLLVLVDGKIAYEWLAEGMTADTRHILMSATKSIVGLVCGVLADRGLLDVELLASHYVPEIAATGYAGATVRQLLDMRAQPQLSEADLKTYALATNWEPIPPGHQPADLHAFFKQLPAVGENAHGGVFRYLSANTDLLGWVIERATGRSFAELTGSLLWSPLGAQSPAEITLDRAGAPRCTGGICATLRDFARIGQLVVDDGVYDGDGVVPLSWIEDIAVNGDRQAWAQGEFARSFGALNMHYRSGWYVIDHEPQVLFAMGIYGQHLFVDRANRIVIAKLSSLPQPLDPVAIGMTLRAVWEIRRCLGR